MDADASQNVLEAIRAAVRKPLIEAQGDCREFGDDVIETLRRADAMMAQDGEDFDPIYEFAWMCKTLYELDMDRGLAFGTVAVLARRVVDLEKELRAAKEPQGASVSPDVENPYPDQELGTVDFNASGYSITPIGTNDLFKANVATSRIKGKYTHKPLLDLDMPAKLIPSSTPGHFHLFIDCEMEWETYTELLLALAAAGILEPGYVHASLDRGCTAARLPWIKKEKKKVFHRDTQ